MSMIGNFVQLTPVRLQMLIDDPTSVEAFIYPSEGDADGCIDIGKAWHGVHFMLTGDPWGGTLPLANVVLGGVEIGNDVGYGPAHYITAEEVHAVAEALRAIPPEELAKRYDAAEMLRNQTYPEIWHDDDDAIDFLLSHYESLRNYYLDAASKRNAMLKYFN